MYTPEQRKKWNEFLRYSKIITNRIVKTGNIALEEKELKNQAILSVATLASRIWVISPRFAAASLSSRAINNVLSKFQRRELRALMNEAVFNAELVKDLMPINQDSIKKLHLWMVELGIRSDDSQKQDQPIAQETR